MLGDGAAKTRHRVYSPMALMSALRKAHPSFKGNHQQDAHELFMHLLGTLEDEEDAFIRQKLEERKEEEEEEQRRKLERAQGEAAMVHGKSKAHVDGVAFGDEDGKSIKSIQTVPHCAAIPSTKPVSCICEIASDKVSKILDEAAIVSGTSDSANDSQGQNSRDGLDSPGSSLAGSHASSVTSTQRVTSPAQDSQSDCTRSDTSQQLCETKPCNASDSASKTDNRSYLAAVDEETRCGDAGSGVRTPNIVNLSLSQRICSPVTNETKATLDKTGMEDTLISDDGGETTDEGDAIDYDENSGDDFSTSQAKVNVALAETPPGESLTVAQVAVVPGSKPELRAKGTACPEKERVSPPRAAVTEVFGGSLCSVVTCGSCRARSFSTEPTVCLSLVIPPRKSRNVGRTGASSGLSAKIGTSNSDAKKVNGRKAKAWEVLETLPPGFQLSAKEKRKRARIERERQKSMEAEAAADACHGDKEEEAVGEGSSIYVAEIADDGASCVSPDQALVDEVRHCLDTVLTQVLAAVPKSGEGTAVSAEDLTAAAISSVKLTAETGADGRFSEDRGKQKTSAVAGDTELNGSAQHESDANAEAVKSYGHQMCFCTDGPATCTVSLEVRRELPSPGRTECKPVPSTNQAGGVCNGRWCGENVGVNSRDPGGELQSKEALASAVSCKDKSGMGGGIADRSVSEREATAHVGGLAPTTHKDEDTPGTSSRVGEASDDSSCCRDSVRAAGNEHKSGAGDPEVATSGTVLSPHGDDCAPSFNTDTTDAPSDESSRISGEGAAMEALRVEDHIFACVKGGENKEKVESGNDTNSHVAVDGEYDRVATATASPPPPFLPGSPFSNLVEPPPRAIELYINGTSGAIDLYACLDHFMAEEELVAAEGNGYDCENCRSGGTESPTAQTDEDNDEDDGEQDPPSTMRDARKRLLMLGEPPGVLVCHLKRLQAQKKILTRVEFPEMLDMAPYFWQNSQAALSATATFYRLFGLVEHRGNRSGGHYVAYVRDADGWKHASDADTRPAYLTEVKRSNAYMLFYERTDRDLVSVTEPVARTRAASGDNVIVGSANNGASINESRAEPVDIEAQVVEEGIAEKGEAVICATADILHDAIEGEGSCPLHAEGVLTSEAKCNPPAQVTEQSMLGDEAREDPEALCAQQLSLQGKSILAKPSLPEMDKSFIAEALQNGTVAPGDIPPHETGVGDGAVEILSDKGMAAGGELPEVARDILDSKERDAVEGMCALGTETAMIPLAGQASEAISTEITVELLR